MPGGVTTRAAEASQEPHWAQELLGDLCPMPANFLPSKTDLAKHYFSIGTNGNRKQLLKDMAQQITAVCKSRLLLE